MTCRYLQHDLSCVASFEVCDDWVDWMDRELREDEFEYCRSVPDDIDKDPDIQTEQGRKRNEWHIIQNQ